MFHLIFGLPWLVVVVRLIWPLPWPLSARIVTAFFLLIVSQFHLWSRITSGSVFAPEFPRPIIIAFNWLFGSIVLAAVFQMAFDAASLVAVGAGLGLPGTMIWPRYLIGLAALALAAQGVRQAVGVPALAEVRVVIRDLPARFEGYRIVQLTDLHVSRLFPAGWTRRIVDMTNGLAADLIVITGDVIDGSVENRRADVEPLRKLHALDGVFFIPGNHEYLSGYDQWMEHLAGLGMQPLPNAHAVIVRDDDRMVVAGVTDRSAHGVGREAPDLAKALKGVPAGAPIVLLDHEPRNAPSASDHGIGLQLSGHTHGGMILGLDRIVARANGGFVSGAYAVGAMTLYVGNGTGIWPGFALRLGRASELTCFTLSNAAAPGSGDPPGRAQNS